MILNSNEEIVIPKLSPTYDPWDPLRSIRKHGKHVLTSVEMTVSNLCNMRCEHCAVGDSLTMSEPAKMSLDLMLKRLDEVEFLETISITGGEPTFNKATVKDYIIPLLKYARERGIRSQINSNLTLDLTRYEDIAPWLDVMHISFNYLNADDFHEVGFVRSAHPVGRNTAVKMYERMVNNTVSLSKGGLFVSAETMINYRTHQKLGAIHELIDQMGCLRHEVHPMYHSAFAANLPKISLDQLRDSIHKLLDVRNRKLWMLFGTLPFFACNDSEADLDLIRRLRTEPNVTMRNDPDGRNRLNVNLFDGNVFITDFANEPAQGNIQQHGLDSIFNNWTNHPLHTRFNCFCETASCCGPNLLVADAYYHDVDFKLRKAK